MFQITHDGPTWNRARRVQVCFVFLFCSSSCCCCCSGLSSVFNVKNVIRAVFRCCKNAAQPTTPVISNKNVHGKNDERFPRTNDGKQKIETNKHRQESFSSSSTCLSKIKIGPMPQSDETRLRGPSLVCFYSLTQSGMGESDI